MASILQKKELDKIKYNMFLCLFYYTGVRFVMEIVNVFVCVSVCLCVC